MSVDPLPPKSILAGQHFPVVGIGVQKFVNYYKRIDGEWVASFMDAITGLTCNIVFLEEPTFLKSGHRYRLEVNIVDLDIKHETNT